METDLIRISRKTATELREYTLKKFGKIHGRIGHEAEAAISGYIKSRD